MRRRPVRARLTAALAALLCASVAVAAPARAQAPSGADVLIQAGHEGRPDCAVEPASLCNNTGAPGEIAWTPIVADEAARVLRAHGISVLRMPAHLSGPYTVKDAVFIHFDGNVIPCSSGASVGYPATGNSQAAADAWKALYGKAIPFAFQADNFTPNLRGYYGYHHVHATDAEFLIEGGEISCPAQHAWLAKHLAWEGDLIAYFIARRLGNTTVPLPPLAR